MAEGRGGRRGEGFARRYGTSRRLRRSNRPATPPPPPIWHEFLFAHVTKPQFHARVSWVPNQVRLVGQRPREGAKSERGRDTGERCGTGERVRAVRRRPLTRSPEGGQRGTARGAVRSHARRSSTRCVETGRGASAPFVCPVARSPVCGVLAGIGPFITGPRPPLPPIIRPSTPTGGRLGQPLHAAHGDRRLGRREPPRHAPRLVRGRDAALKMELVSQGWIPGRTHAQSPWGAGFEPTNGTQSPVQPEIRERAQTSHSTSGSMSIRSTFSSEGWEHTRRTCLT